MTDHPAIAQRASLRRADWRFLLPNPPEGSFQHLVLLGGPAGLAKRIVEEGIARRVSCEIPKERSADAVAILHNAQVILRDAAGCLMPGGAPYYEIYRRSPPSLTLTPGRIQRSLLEMELSPTGIYWVRPNFANYEIYLSLDAQRAIEWHLKTLFAAATPARRFLEPVLRILAWFGSRPLALLASCYAVTAIAGSDRGIAPSVLGHSSLPRELRRLDLRRVVLTSGHSERSRVIMFPFAPNASQPAVVLKMPRRSDFNVDTEREHAVLTELRSFIDEPMGRTIPQPIATLRNGELFVGIESYTSGRRLQSSTCRWQAPMYQKIEDLRLATGWLCKFHQQAQFSRDPWGTREIACWVEAPLVAYSEIFGMAANEKRLFGEVRKRAIALTGVPFPIVWHHDFSGPNIYRAGSEIKVVDWEHAGPGLALSDLLSFVTSWSFVARGLRGDDEQLHGFRELFLEPICCNKSVKAVRQAIRHYMRCLDIDHRFFPLLLVLTWVQDALGQRAVGETGEDNRYSNMCVQYIRILAEHTERLFAESIIEPSII